MLQSTMDQAFETVQKDLSDIASHLPWEDPKIYQRWLIQTYEYAVHSTRILALAGGFMPLNKTRLSNRFIKHSAEEKGHELLLESDARNLGFDITTATPTPAAKAFHQSLYYWLGHGSSLGLMGWVLALEGFAVRNVPAVYKRCSLAYGPRATSFLRVLSEEDPDHLEKAFEALRDFNQEDTELITKTLQQYGATYGNILKDMENDLLWDEFPRPSMGSESMRTYIH